MKWFRFYTEALHDPKVQRLHPALFKHWVNILCVANRNRETGILPSVEDLSFQLRMKPVEVQKVLNQLIEKGLLDSTEAGQLFPHKWTERQRNSDVVSTRVQRYREKKDHENNTLQENVTLQKRTVDTDIEEEKKKTKNLSEKKTSRPISSDHQFFLRWWSTVYEATNGVPYMVQTKDGVLAAKAVKAIPLRSLLGKAAAYLFSDREYFRSNLDIPSFVSHINKMTGVNLSPEHVSWLRENDLAPGDGIDFEEWKNGKKF